MRGHQTVGLLFGLFGLWAFPPQPVAPTRPVIDDYHGIKVSDPYRYMENLKDPEVQTWLRAQDTYTRAVLARIPARDKLLARFRELDESAPAHVSELYRLPGDLYFYKKLAAGESTAKLYVRRGVTGPERMLVDPERIRVQAASHVNGKNALLYFTPSDDAKYVAVAIAPGGSEDDTEIHVVDTASGAETGDVITRAAFGFDWLPDGHRLIVRPLQDLPPGAPGVETRQNVRSYVHVVGSGANRGEPVFGMGAVPSIPFQPDELGIVTAQPGANYVFGIVNSGGIDFQVYIAPSQSIGKADTPWRKAADFSDCVKDFLVNGDDLYFRSCKDAPRFKILRLDARTGDLSSAETVVPPGEIVLNTMVAAKDALYVQALESGLGRLLRVSYGPKPSIERVHLPVEGKIDSLTADPRVEGVVFGMTSWTQALKYYAFDPKSQKVFDTKLQPLGPYDNPPNLRADEVKVRSHDGVPVPLSIVYRKGLKLDGSNPTHLQGYGAYGNSQDPFFMPWQLAWNEQGGIFAVCHVRGGGEYGEEWHLAGKGPTKPNTWRDFIACAEYLVAKGYTSPKHLSAAGGSAGGILVGRAITERPDLFSAAVDMAGCSDMVRLEAMANGELNIPEFGSTKTPDGFKALFQMSPYHHVEDGTVYPAVLLTTGINDPRVDSWQAAKLAARLQRATTSGKPVLLRVDWEGGHGVGSTEQQMQQEIGDAMSFELWQLGVPAFQPSQHPARP